MSWRVTLHCSRAEAEALPESEDLFPFAETPPVIVADEPDPHAPDDWRIHAYFADRPTPDDLALLNQLAAGSTPQIDHLGEDDWVTMSQAGLEPIRAGRFFVHTPMHRDRIPAGTTAFEIDAGLAFGSGEHATTHSCLLAVDTLARRRRFRRVLDVGCGSGVLAIAAAKCWPAQVVAVDNDPIAVRVAAENMRLNGVAARVRVELADGYRHPLVRRLRPFDLILANILADPLIELAPALRRHLAPGGHAVLSGLLDRQAAAVIRAHCRQGLHLVQRVDQGPWTALVLAAPRVGR